MTGARARRAAELAALAAVLVALSYCSWFRLTGGHWERVESPSMGTTAPVGTLLWVRPVAAGELRVGDVVTFQQPGVPTGPRYSHRVREVEADGSFKTRGDLSGDDEWTVQPGDVVGRVQWVWPGVGRLVQAAPVLVSGAAATSGLLVLVGRRGRLPVAILGASLTLAAALVVYQPLTGALLLGTRQVEHGVRATYVSTGLLPVRISAPSGDSVVLHAGESGAVTSSEVVDGRLRLDVGPAVQWWLWAVVVGGSFVPAVGSSLLGSRDRSPGRRVAVPA